MGRHRRGPEQHLARLEPSNAPPTQPGQGEPSPTGQLPGLELLDLLADPLGLLPVFLNPLLVLLYLPALLLQLADQVVLDDGEGGRGVVGQGLHHCNRRQPVGREWKERRAGEAPAVSIQAS